MAEFKTKLKRLAPLVWEPSMGRLIVTRPGEIIRQDDSIAGRFSCKF